MESISDWMKERKRGNRRSVYQLGYLVAAVLIAAALLLTAFEISNHSISPNAANSTAIHPPSIKQNFSAVQDIYQYDGGINHTYSVGINLKPLNIDVNSAIIGTPTIYNGDLLITTMGNLSYLDKFQYDKTNSKVLFFTISLFAWIF